jgi:hypothetical protein
MQNARMEIPQPNTYLCLFWYTTLAHEEQLDTLPFAEGGAREEDRNQGSYSCCLFVTLGTSTLLKLVPVHLPQFPVEQNLCVGGNFRFLIIL